MPPSPPLPNVNPVLELLPLLLELELEVLGSGAP
jgi:hypothetical protein